MRNQSNGLHANKNPPYFIHEIKTMACEVNGVNVFHRKLMRIHRKKKRPKTCLLYYYNSKNDNHHYSHLMVSFNPQTYKQSGTPTPTVVQDEANIMRSSAVPSSKMAAILAAILVFYPKLELIKNGRNSGM